MLGSPGQQDGSYSEDGYSQEKLGPYTSLSKLLGKGFLCAVSYSCVLIVSLCLSLSLSVSLSLSLSLSLPFGFSHFWFLNFLMQRLTIYPKLTWNSHLPASVS
jgi:hypothetical protein